jgi:hypothetical protein
LRKYERIGTSLSSDERIIIQVILRNKRALIEAEKIFDEGQGIGGYRQDYLGINL